MSDDPISLHHRLWERSVEGIKAPVVRVIPMKDELFEKVLRRFRGDVEKAGILKAAKVRKHYEKPSERKKRKARAARKRWIKRVRKVNRGY